MKRSVTLVLFRAAVLAIFLSALLPHSGAQTFSNLYSFAATVGPQGVNVNGGYPGPGLVLADGALYGITGYGGTAGGGAVFKFNLNGGGITNLHSFSALSGPNPGTNSDGIHPQGGLIRAGDTLYGVTYEGGVFGYGAVFAVKTDGTGFTNLHSYNTRTGPSLTNTDGANPDSGLVLAGSTLYGTTTYGGSAGGGTIFALRTDGSGFTNLHNFTGYPADGATPQASLLLAGSLLYGTTAYGGSNGAGTIYVLNTNGGGYSIVRHFAGGTNDGYIPSGVILSGVNLYGTTYYGGREDAGTVFKVSTNGTGYTNLHSFTAPGEGGFPATSTDGSGPQGELILLGRALFGMTGSGGALGYGVQFALNTDGSGFMVLHHNSYNDGYFGNGGMIVSSNTFYGTEAAGGDNGSGTIFSLTLPSPTMSVSRAGTNAVLSWPTNNPGFALQFTTNLAPPLTWSTSPLIPVILNGQNAITNPLIGGQRFYRLIR